MSVLTENYFLTSNDSGAAGVSSRDAHYLRSRFSTTLSPRQWTTDKVTYLDLAVSCVSCLGDTSDVSSKKVSFDRSNHEEEQIKRLEFMLGELRIDMQILFERNCFPAPSVVSVGSTTSIKTKDASAQTESNLSNESNCDTDSSVSEINILQSADVRIQNEKINQQNDEYQKEILHLRQEKDKWQCENNEQKQTIESLCHEIEQKNQLLTTAKVFIDASIKNSEDADIVKNFSDNLNHRECEHCSLTSNLLAQTQLEKDKLNLQKNQLEKMLLSYETEIETLDRKLQQSMEKNVHLEKSLDQICCLKSELESKNETLTHRAYELRKKVAAFEIQRSHQSGTQSKESSKPSKSHISVKKTPSQNELITKSMTEHGILSPGKQIESLDDDANKRENKQLTEKIRQLELKSTDMTLANAEINQNFKESYDTLSEDLSVTTQKGAMLMANDVLQGSTISTYSHDEIPLSESELIMKSRTKPLAMIEHKQIDRKSHSSKFMTDDSMRKRTINIDKKRVADKTPAKIDKTRVDKTITVPKSKLIVEKSRNNLLNEKRKCNLTKQTNQNTMGTKGRAESIGSLSVTNMTFSENKVIKKSKTKPSNKYQPEAKHRPNFRKRSFIEQKENQNMVTNQYANTDSGKKLSPKSINPQDAAQMKYNNMKTKSKSLPLTTRQSIEKLHQKSASVPNILIRVVHEDEKKQLSESFTTNVVDSLSMGASTSTIISSPTTTTITTDDPRADRLHYLCQLINERNSIDMLSFDDLNFLNENLNDVVLSEQLIVSKIDLQERLRQIENFETQLNKSTESKKWCSIT